MAIWPQVTRQRLPYFCNRHMKQNNLWWSTPANLQSHRQLPWEIRVGPHPTDHQLQHNCVVTERTHHEISELDHNLLTPQWSQVTAQLCSYRKNSPWDIRVGSHPTWQWKPTGSQVTAQLCSYRNNSPWDIGVGSQPTWQWQPTGSHVTPHKKSELDHNPLSPHWITSYSITV